MAAITECDDHDRDEFWQHTSQDVAGATETGAQAAKAARCACGCHKPAGAAGGSSWAIGEAGEVIVTDPDALKGLLAYLAAAKDEQDRDEGEQA